MAMGQPAKSARRNIEDFVGPCSSRLVSRFDSESRVSESNNRPVYRAQRVFQADVALWAPPNNEYDNKPKGPSNWQDTFLNDSTSAHLVLDREADLSRKATLEHTETDRANCYERNRRELYSQFPRRCINGEGEAHHCETSAMCTEHMCVQGLLTTLSLERSQSQWTQRAAAWTTRTCRQLTAQLNGKAGLPIGRLPTVTLTCTTIPALCYNCSIHCCCAQV